MVIKNNYSSTEETPTSILKVIGSKLRAARVEIGLTQQKICDLINQSIQAPKDQTGETEILLLNRYKKWEYGDNPVDIRWLPAICEILKCDYGYLFGDHACKTKDIQGIMDYTGLSEDCITTLSNLNLFEKVFLERLLNPQSRLHLYELSDSYTKYKKFVDLVRTYGIEGAEIPDSDMMDLITDENKIAFMRFKLSDSFLRFVDDSTK